MLGEIIASANASSFNVGISNLGLISIFLKENNMEKVYITEAYASTTLLSLLLSDEYLDKYPLDTAQAVSYIETCSNEEINELVTQIDLVLNDSKSYTKTLKK